MLLKRGRLNREIRIALTVPHLSRTGFLFRD
jgi:hypothetical protein